LQKDTKTDFQKNRKWTTKTGLRPAIRADFKGRLGGEDDRSHAGNNREKMGGTKRGKITWGPNTGSKKGPKSKKLLVGPLKGSGSYQTTKKEREIWEKKERKKKRVFG